MKMLPLLLVLSLSQVCLAQRYTLYIPPPNVAQNPDGSFTLTSTLSYTFNDGSSCSPFDGLAGYDVPFYMQNGNGPWAQDSAGAFRTGENMTVYTGHTFPNVTVQPGQTVDLSVGVKLQQTCWRQPRYAYYPPYGSVGSFYGVDFIDGEGGIAPSPCDIPGILSNPPEPNCPPWPGPVWTVVPYAAFHSNLDSEAVPQMTPGVTISGPTNVPMLASGSQGSDSVTLTANPNPSGGTFQWRILSGDSNIHLLNDTSQSSIVQSVAVGSFTVEVEYSYNGWEGTAVAVGKVQQPAFLSVPAGDDAGFVYDFNCRNTPPDYPPYTAGTRRITYQVLDTAPQPIPAAGMIASESLLPVSNSCVHIDYPIAGRPAATAPDGTFGPDALGHLCSISCLPADSSDHPLGSCQMQVQQTWSVNGFNVQTRSVAFTCQALTLQ